MEVGDERVEIGRWIKYQSIVTILTRRDREKP
jgi:hypothetical protein